MQTRRVKCPGCGALLSLPGEIRDRLVRCGLCRRAFRLPGQIVIPEDTIFGWLHQPREEEDERADTLALLSGDLQRGQTVRAGRQDDGRGKRLRLVSLERRGALLEFPAEYLRRDEFRSAIPRVCVHCLGRAHLSAHLIIFAPQLRDSISLEVEHKTGGLTIPQERLGDLHGSELLQHLPEVPNVPDPANLPMPYWVCDLCSGAGEISGQIQIDTTAGRGLCRLYIRNLQVAASFYANVAGTEKPGYAKFVEFFRHMREDRWDALPSVVRHRLEQWFRPVGKERFLAYVPDRNRARTEDGMAGVVVSTGRLVYRRPPLHHELPVETPLTLQVRTFGAKKKIATIHTADSKPRSVTLDHKGEMTLRQALSEGHFKAVWR